MAEAVKDVSDKKEENVSDEKLPESFFIAFNEVCTEETKFQCTLISTKTEQNSFCISSTQNMVSKELYNAGNRISGTCKLTASDEFYALVPRRDQVKKTDETQIQKYKVIKNKNENKFEIKFIKLIGIPFQNTGINSEGIAIIESDDAKDEFKGFLIVNDVYCQPENNSNLYFINNKMESKILHSLNDKGAAELNDMCALNAFGKNGYLILPQSLNLGYIDDKNNLNWSVFETWMVSNEGDASLFFVDKNNILKAIENCEAKENEKVDVQFERIPVYLSGDYKSKTSVFSFLGDKENDGYVVEGFEALALDGNNNMVLLLECSKGKDTFNFILTATFKINKEKDNELGVYFNPCVYTRIDNNGGGANCAQEALIYCKLS